MRQRFNLHSGCWALLLLLFGLYLTFFPALSVKAATHVTQQVLSKTQFTTSSDEILARARTWTSIKVAYSQSKPYYPDNQTGYRPDCSGFVTMAWGLSNQPNGGLNTDGLATVSYQISKKELQPGDILLNTRADAHVVLFGGWIDANGNITKTVTGQYDALEENGDYQDGYGYAVEHTIPYPYYSGYYPEDYIPMRLNSLSNPPVSSLPSTPQPPQPPTPVIPPTPIPPTPVPDPIVSHTYSGQVVGNNGVGTVTMTFTSVVQNQDGSTTIQGSFSVASPLSNYSGTFNGTIDNGTMQFTVTPSDGSTPMVYSGTPYEGTTTWEGQYTINGISYGSWQIYPSS